MNRIIAKKTSIIKDYEGILRKIYLISDWYANTKYYLNDLYDNCTDYNNLLELIYTIKTMSHNFLNTISISAIGNSLNINNIENHESIVILLYNDGVNGEISLIKSENVAFRYDLSSFKDVHKNDKIKQLILFNIKYVYKKIYSKYFMS